MSLLFACAIATAGAPARAQDRNTIIATQKFKQGVKALDAQNYEAARQLFQQVYDLKSSAGVLLNLGLSEVGSGKVEDGANHLQRFLREWAKASEDQKQAARDAIDDARKKTGEVIFVVDTSGAIVAIDGLEIGKSPLADSRFVKPGEHEATATVGAVARQKFTVTAGAPTTVSLKLTPEPKAKGPAEPDDPSSVSSAPVAAAPADPDAWKRDLPANENPFAKDESAAKVDKPPVDSANPNDLGPWLKRKPGADVLLGLSALGVVGAVGFGIDAGMRAGTANRQADQIRAQVTTPDGQIDPLHVDAGGKPIPCGNPADPNGAQPYYKSACETLGGTLKARDVDLGMMTAGIVLAVLAGGGTVLYYYLDTKKSPAQAAFVTIAPIVTPRQQTLGVLGSF